jgi:hypothetical protein
VTVGDWFLRRADALSCRWSDVLPRAISERGGDLSCRGECIVYRSACAGCEDLAMPRPIAIADVWRDILNGAPGARRGDPLLLSAASEHPALNRLYPFPSHGTLHFFRTIPPTEDDLPFIVCDTSRYEIYTPRYGRLVATATTPEEAVALFAAILADFAGKPTH